MAAVAEFLDEMAVKGWQWGERDCLLWLGLWSERVTGIDGGAPWRGRYRTALGCARALNRSGGMVACIERGTKLCGMIPISEYRAGDIGIVMTWTARGIKEVGAICAGKKWAMLTSNGVFYMRADPVKAWGVR